MYLPTDYLRDLREFLNFTIEYNISKKKYKINDLWIDEIDDRTYDPTLNSLKSLLTVVLRNCEDKSNLLSKVISDLDSVCQWYDHNHLRSFNFFQHLQKIITEVDDNSIYNVTEQYSIKDIVDESSGDTIFDPLFYYLKVYEPQTNKYQNPQDFEKVKLMHKLSLLIDSIKELKEYALILEENISEFKIRDFHNEEDLKIETSKLRCTVGYDKITTANLFHILLKSGIFYFDKKDEIRNSQLMKEFINENFNYTNASSAVQKIEKIEKEFSYINYKEHKERQRDILGKMIAELEIYKGKL